MKRRQTMILLTLMVMLVVAIVYLLNRRLDKIVYAERQEMLSMVMKSSAETVERAIVSEWDVYNLSYSIINHALQSTKELEECISEVNSQHDFGTDYYFMVDENGMYYSSDGAIGKLKNFDNYTKTSEDRIEYLSTLPHMNPKKIYMIFRGRFDEPVRVKTDNGEVMMIFFAYAQDLTTLRNAITSTFKNSTNTFIFDSKGTMLYREFDIKMLIEGYNIFQKLEACKMPFGENAEELVLKCKEKKTFVVHIKIGDNKYYFCSAPLNISDWSLAFLIQPQNLDVVMGHGMQIIVLYIILIVAIVGFTLMYITLTIRRKINDERLDDSRKLAEAMKEASDAKTVFLSNMSHDIRTPINGIMGVTTLAKGAVNNPEKVTEYLDKIDTASHHLLSLVNDVLDMSRIESGKTKVTAEPADIREICENCCGIIKDQLSDRKLTFKSEIDAEHPQIFADEVHLRRIFINILSNSVKFTRDGGRILFRCKETNFTSDNVTYRFEFKDTGIGMSKQFLGRIYDAFSQEENRERTNYTGTGLGMAITKQLIDLMGGTIEVDSEVNKGSSFYVTLTFERDFETHKKQQEEDTKDASIEGVKILLVEDNELNKEIAIELLQANGAKVEHAWDGLEAIDKFTANDIGTYDVILMDIMMPRMNGIEAAKAIRATEREDAKTIPIIAMTANAFDDDIKATSEAGMNAHLSKPIDIEKVIATIASFVKR